MMRLEAVQWGKSGWTDFYSSHIFFVFWFGIMGERVWGGTRRRGILVGEWSGFYEKGFGVGFGGVGVGECMCKWGRVEGS